MRTPSAVYFPKTGHHFLFWEEQGRETWVIGGELLQGKWTIKVLLNTGSLDDVIQEFSCLAIIVCKPLITLSLTIMVSSFLDVFIFI